MNKGEIIRKFETKCPRCGREATITKTTKFYITNCNSCNFEMGNPY